VYMILEIDFIPKTSPAAKGIKPVRPIWMDVRNGQIYPVFNVEKGSGEKGEYTYPNDEPAAYRGESKRNEWVSDRDGVLVATAGHLHPGGYHTDLWVRRQGAKVAKPACASKTSSSARKACKSRAPRGYGSNAHLFRSDANYFEPAGAVSWDVAMTGTRGDWRVKINKGDTLWTSATYGTKRGAWWESMGIMVAYMADSGSGKNPFKKRVDYSGKPTHGHLRENRNHGGGKSSLPDPRQLPDGPTVTGGEIDILNFKYAVGDLSLAGSSKNPPVIQQGQSVTFRNLESGKRLYHSITSCKAPCTGKTGIAYPLADASVSFDSNTLGKQIPAAGSDEWTTPANLKPGTYTYFCRIHPFMRGAFRVK
jgi:plastocyanin